MLIILASIGIIFSVYILYVQYRLKKNKKYKAVCDLSNRFSCTGVISTNYSYIFGLPNALWGLMYYITIIILNDPLLVFSITLPAVLLSAYLLMVTMLRIKRYCLVCNASHLLNLIILIYVLIK
ncbi:vitamin K epoxide reductase family protein [Candidatus Woesearchaeota archaeon]|nr:vitamin K epoxide reductase family protein [Candidatus Woesearchaeota archaeon]